MESAASIRIFPLPEAYSSPLHLHRYFGVQLEKTVYGRTYIFRYFDPVAEAVFLTAGFLSWDVGKKMTRLDNGVWEYTLPTDRSLEGECYKFKVTANGVTTYRTDPFAKREEGQGENASVIAAESPEADRLLPFCRSPRSDALHVLEASLSSFFTKGNRLPYEDGAAPSFRELAEKLTIYTKSTGFTHVKLTPQKDSGSLFAPCARHGTPEDFAAFVDILHQNGVGVIASLPFWLENTDYRLILSAADYLLSHYAFDGISFEGGTAAPDATRALLYSLSHLKAAYPDAILLAEQESAETPSPIRAYRSTAREKSFTDVLFAPPNERESLLPALTAALLESGTLASQSKALTYEGKGSLMESFFGSYEQKFSQSRLYRMLLMAAKGPKLSFMLQSLAPFRPWHDDLLPEWYMADFKLHRAHRRFVRALNRFYLETSLLYQADTDVSLMHYDAPRGIFSIKHRGKEGELIFVFNCSDRLALAYPLAVDRPHYTERFSSDEERYAGEGYVHRIPLFAKEGTLILDLAPLCAVILQPNDCNDE